MNPLRGRLAGRIRRQALTLGRLACRLRRRLDPACIHDLRVLTRRLRAAVWLGRALAPEKPFDPARRLLRKLGRCLGARRALDVAASDAVAHGLNPARLEPLRAAAGKAVERRLSPVRQRRVLAALETAARALRHAGDAPDRLARALDRHARRLGVALARAGRSHAALHRLRIQAKKVRYVLEALGRDGDFLRPLQRRIGRAHDLDVMQSLLGAHPRAAGSAHRARKAARRMMHGVVRRALARLEASL